MNENINLCELLKVPKTWSELVKRNKDKTCYVEIDEMAVTTAETSIEKSALALLKIYQIIEVGYGGNITNEEWANDRNYKYGMFCSWDNTLIVDSTIFRNRIAFHTRKQAKEFLSYPENVQLVKDFYMI